MNIVWDSWKYKDNFSFVPNYGNDLLALIDFDKAKTAIDLGCGNGTLTEELRKKGLAVMGMDASEDMLALARKDHPEIPFMQADATEFRLSEKVDLVFSNAVFHWIDEGKQQRLLRNISEALKPEGQLVFEFGGHGCAENVHAMLEQIFSEHGYRYPRCFYFPTIGEYAPIVEESGFHVKAAFLFDRPTPQKGEDGLENWIRMFVKTPFEIVPEQEERDEIIREVLQRLKTKLYLNGTWYVDYVRIRMKALKRVES